MTPLLALHLPGGIVRMVILLIIFCAVIAIAFVAIKAMGLQVPGWVIQIFWIIVIAVVAIFANKLLLEIV